METLKNFLLFLLLLFCAAGLLLFPEECAEAARNGLSLCLQTVLPSLYPFFVLSSLVIASGMGDTLSRCFEPLMRPLFGLSGAGAGALVLGLLGGYPVGARTAAELYRGGSLSKDEAERLLACCNNAGPGFLLGVCGNAIFHSARVGLSLFLVHALSAMLTGMLLCRIGAKGTPVRPQQNASVQRKSMAAEFPRAVRDSFFSVWSVCGFVVLFMVLLRLLTLLLPPGIAEPPFYPLLLGFVELTNGVMALPATRQGFVLCAALLGWGGLSVHAQTLSVLENSGLSARRFFAAKMTQAALSVPLALVVSMHLF